MDVTDRNKYHVFNENPHQCPQSETIILVENMSYC